MDDFDDSLSSSTSHPFDHNPFANPFDRPRSSSPDPWSTFARHQATYETPDASVDDGFQSTSELTEGDNRHVKHEQEGVNEAEECEDIHETQTKSSSTEETEVRERSLSSVQSPGFRESIGAEEDKYKSAKLAESPPTIKDIVKDEKPQPPSETPSCSGTPKSSSPTRPTVIEQKTTFGSPSPTPVSSSKFISPLESPATGISQTFASLSLGGESAGGWQDEHIDYTSSTPKTAENATQSEAEVASSTKGSTDGHENRIDDEESSESRPLFQISVEDPQKVGDPIRPYILYTVSTKTTSPLFKKPSFSVLRRYSDFLWLYETLCFNNAGVIVPPVPEKSPFGRFDNLFVQQRRLALEICIRKIANHPVLSKDPDLRLFLESDTFALDIKHRKSESAGGLLSGIGQTLTGSRFSEVDDWFDRKKAYLDGLESQLKGLVKAIDSVSKQRAELATANGEFAQSVGDLSESDLSSELCRSLSSLSSVQKKAQDLQHTQAQEDTITLMTTVEEYSRVISSVRMAFASRVRCHLQWQNAENEARRVKQAYEKARSQGRIPPDRTGQSIAQVAEAERRALDAKHDFERCSRLVKSELARFEQERIGDFKQALEVFLEGMIKRQKELINAWEGHQELLLKRVNAKPIAAESYFRGQTSTA